MPKVVNDIKIVHYLYNLIILLKHYKIVFIFFYIYRSFNKIFIYYINNV